jgi:hypothetical protein
MLVNTNKGMLRIRSGGVDKPPRVSVTPNAISRQMYNVPPNRIKARIDSGYSTIEGQKTWAVCGGYITYGDTGWGAIL